MTSPLDIPPVSVTAPTTAASPSALADAQARERILTDLQTNLLVEAGAGSGKTTSLVGRMLALVAGGEPVEAIAAVTFTRKAAGELRERFQILLETTLAELRTDRAANPARVARLDRALRDIDRAFLGTIHSFCGRLLRERPLEAGLDPDFAEVTEQEWASLRDGFWRRWIARRLEERDPALAALEALGLDAAAIGSAFATLVQLGDVVLPASPTPVPDGTACRAALRSLVDDGMALVPSEPIGERDELQGTLRRLDYLGRQSGWGSVRDLAEGVELLAVAKRRQVTQNRWGSDKDTKARAKLLGERVEAFMCDGAPREEGRGRARTVVMPPVGEGWMFLEALRVHRYAPLLAFAAQARDAFVAERLAAGHLGFEDLLSCTARLLRSHPGARRELGERYRYLLVDEFQDTDPRQAEICLLLASPPEQGAEWARCVPRPGALFVVGDPKQSIYRFRRADVSTYDGVRRRFETFGAVLRLTVNFRSAPPIAEFVNDRFAAVFPSEPSPSQAAFAPMIPAPKNAWRSGLIGHHAVPTNASLHGACDADAVRVASWIAARIAAKECTAGDVLVLTYQTAHVTAYARALAERNVPVRTDGAELMQEDELRELVLVLRLLADPDDGVLVGAVLEGLFFGCSAADLWAATEAGSHLAITRSPESSGPADGASPDAPAVARVRSALGTLHGWWRAAQRHTADHVLERILDETGLLAHAASADLGDVRAGALLQLCGVVREAVVGSETGLRAAVSAIEQVLVARGGADTAILPPGTDAVRVMNAHKAKGLEARIVVLAAPAKRDPKRPRQHVWRDADGETLAAVQLVSAVGNSVRVLAQPADWAACCEAEAAMLDTEWERLLYVAVTRAEEEILVSTADARNAQGEPHEVATTWQALAPSLAVHGRRLTLPDDPPPGRRATERTSASVSATIDALAERRKAAATPGFRVTTVTGETKRGTAERRDGDDRTNEGDLANGGDRLVMGGRGAAWGTVVHALLEQAGRGRPPASLAGIARALARREGVAAEGAALDEAVAELLRAVERARATPGWQLLARAGARGFEVPLMECRRENGTTVVTEGVLDAVALDPTEGTIVDWKTDRVSDAVWAARGAQYEAQVGAYAAMLGRITGTPATGRIQRLE